MRMQSDDGTARNWQEALSYSESLEFAGYDYWRLPSTRELQSILDYTHSPSTDGLPAINSLFSCSQITAEDGSTDYPFYWTGTTHIKFNYYGDAAAYVCFGTAFGYMSTLGGWIDVHGAGGQRSDPKAGDPEAYPYGHGPQGDAVRIYHHVRCVRNAF